ncbi:apolipoprotein D-like [Uranotaenia lowii]|uniref:apolipoprotein D-like n=1 Tax=Uranotaenia lowii TaxID=190385 RepID=UPI00247AA49D|nr:apolipoprotein D-like [Uranotaenia lowii]
MKISTIFLPLVILVGFLYFQPTAAQIVSPGICPQYPVVQNFDVERYLGLWYEIKRYEQFFQLDGECVTAQYSINEEDGSVRVFNSMVVLPNQERQSDIGRAVVAFPDEVPLQAKLNVTFDAAAEVSANYWVLDTDYDNFAVVWGCFQLPPNEQGPRRAENAWILSREYRLDLDVIQAVENKIALFLDASQLRETKQDPRTCCSVEEDVTTHPSCAIMRLKSKRV